MNVGRPSVPNAPLAWNLMDYVGPAYYHLSLFPHPAIQCTSILTRLPFTPPVRSFADRFAIIFGASDRFFVPRVHRQQRGIGDF